MSRRAEAGKRRRAEGHPALLLLCSSALLSCANVQPPPGGPPDAAPPELVASYPDSLALLPGFDDEVEFRFSEVVSEGSQPSLGLGTGDLEKLVILSPSARVPDVNWRRRRITVRPAEGWQPNRVYRVELLPGISDVRRNRAKLRGVVTFSTGAPLPEDTLAGTVIDWKAGRPAAGALVEAVFLPDSLPYRALTDSSGNFHVGPLPAGTYLVYGVLDQNNDFRRGLREAFDTVRVGSDPGRVGDIYAFVHDTLPPRIQTVTVNDSVTATVTLALPLDPAQRLDTSAVTLRKLPDSTAVAVRAIRLPAAAADTTQPAPPDSTVVRRRPPLGDRLVIEAAEPWRPGDRFALEIRGVRTVSGVTGDVRAPLVVPDGRPPA
ncbi:MAG TPA: Ig-like domain-containing protein [Gemmatimonadales bacterium]|nr:Ig-like domain-containing protein [Gemmatimonadales bacterium]